MYTILDIIELNLTRRSVRLRPVLPFASVLFLECVCCSLLLLVQYARNNHQPSHCRINECRQDGK
ncbi:hypothetical protein Micbo1qcDRAFT_157388, partial [Microdochium bolleyi]